MSGFVILEDQPNRMNNVNLQGLPTASDYKVYTQREHVLNAPDMWVDSVIPTPRSEYLLINGRIQVMTINVAMAVLKVFMEVLANALDNFSRSCRKGFNPGSLNIIMDKRTITVENGGIPIPVTPHPLGGLVPEIIFGTMYSSSNFTEERNEIGRNGLGSKLANIFSLKFTAKVWDAVNHKFWTGTWVDHMDRCIESRAEDYCGTENKVSITYELDHNYFRHIDGYPEETFYIISRLCADASFTNKVPVTFNNTPYDYRKGIDYAKLYVDGNPNMFVHYEWPPGISVITDKDGTQRAQDGYTLPLVEMVAIDTPEKGFTISFANSMMTSDGGVHIEKCIKTLSDSIVEHVNKGKKQGWNKNNKRDDDENNSTFGGKTKRKPANSKHLTDKEKKEKEKEKQKPKVTLAEVRPNLSVIASVRVKNPIFSSQTKSLLRGPEIELHIPNELLKKMYKWELAMMLMMQLKAKGLRALSKTDGSKRRHLFGAKVDDANFAGTANSHRGILCLIEGKSAKQYVMVMRGCFPNGGDILGALALRGKLINAINNDPEDLAKNLEIIAIKEALGLKEFTDYTSPVNRDDLRYGSIMIMADQDVDGRHIKGLIIAYFAKYFPSLLQCGFVCEYMTPYLRLTAPGKIEYKFYFEEEYKRFLSEHPEAAKWEHKYCKGLASSSPEEVASDSKNPKIVQIVCDIECGTNLRIAFDDDKHFVKLKKKMMCDYDPDKPMDPIGTKQTISSYIKDEHITYSIANLRRQIPSIFDGLKPCQRKLLFACFKKMGRKLANNRNTSVRTFCAYTIEVTNYHHGDSLPGVLAGMTADYVGTNNMRYFIPESLLGCRLDGGKEAGAARYTSFKADWWLPYIFRPEDDDLLDYLVDEGESIEPEFYLSILPPIFNGAMGCGSGWSTFIPNFHPLHLVNYIKCLIREETPPPLVPYYIGFEGTIRIRDKRRAATGDNLMKNILNGSVKIELDDDEIEAGKPIHFNDLLEKEMNNAVGRYSMITTGCMREEYGNIIITELPIGIWTKTYKAKLKEWIKERRLKDMRDLSTDKKVYFELTGFIPPVLKPREGQTIQNTDYQIVDANTLGLTRAYGMSNMILLDSKRHPIKFKSPENIVKDFYVFRLPYYEKRRIKMLQNLTDQINNNIGKYSFIYAVINKRIKIWLSNKNGDDTKRMRKKNDIYTDMDTLGLDRKHLKGTNMMDFTEENLSKILKNIEELRVKYMELEATSAKQIWLNDLNEFEAMYHKHCKDIQKTRVPRGVVIEDDDKPRPEKMKYDFSHVNNIQNNNFIVVED